MENQKSKEEMCAISVDVVNFLAEKNCTIDEAKNILETAKWTIEHSSKVQKFKWPLNPDNKEN